MALQVQTLNLLNPNKTKRNPTARKRMIQSQKRKTRNQSDNRSIKRDGESEEIIFEKKDCTKIIRHIPS